MPPTEPLALRAVEAFDRLPVSPASLGRRAIRSFTDRRRRRAGTDPEWAGIEARRKVPGGSIFLSDDLRLSDWHAQQEIAARLTPDPWWLPAARRMSRLQAADAAYRVREVHQRARRGWADSELWSLDRHLCARLGAQLEELAETASGWPGDDEFPTAEDWDTALRTHGAALARYGTDAGGTIGRALDAWWEQMSKATGREEEDDAAAALQHVEDTVTSDAQAALHWVADHLTHLWD